MATSRVHPEFEKTEAKQSLAYFNWNMVFRNLFDSICGVSGFVFIDYALSLGVPKEKTGFFLSIAYLACLFQIIGLWVTNYAADRKRFVLFFAYLEPLMYVAAVVASLLAPVSLRFPLLIGLIFIAAASVHLTRPTTDDWLATAIPERIRGRFIARRYRLSCFVMIAVMLGMGYVARYINHSYSLGFACFLIAGCGLGLLAAYMFRGITMPKTSAESRLDWHDIPQILRHRLFTRYLIATLLYNVPFWLACPFYSVFHLKVLYLNEITIAYLMVGSFAVKILISPFLGRWVDRFGPRRMIYAIAPFYGSFFLIYFFSNAQYAWLVFPAWWLCAGVGDSVYNVASTTALYQAVQGSPVRQAFFATYNLSCLFLAAIGAAAGTFFVNACKNFTLTLGPFTFGNFQLLYGLAFVLFVFCQFSTQLLPGREQKKALPAARTESA